MFWGHVLRLICNQDEAFGELVTVAVTPAVHHSAFVCVAWCAVHSV